MMYRTPSIAITVWSKHLIRLGLGLGLFSLLLYAGDLRGLQQHTGLYWPPLLGAFVATFFVAGTLAARWATITHALAGRRLTTWRRYFHYFLLSRSLGFVLPKDLTDLGGRAAALNRLHGAPLEIAGASVVLDRLFDLATVALFLPPTVLYWTGWISSSVALGCLVVAPIGAVILLMRFHLTVAHSAITLLNWTAALLRRVPILRRFGSPQLLAPELTGAVVLRAFCLSLAKFAAMTLRMILIAQACQPAVSGFVILMGMPVGQLSYLFAVTPGGLGIFEAGWFGILTLAEVDVRAVTVFLIAQRVVTLVCVVGWTLLSHGYNALHCLWCELVFSHRVRAVLRRRRETI